MLKNLKEMKGFRILAKDSATETFGTVENFYFDDESWAVRYIVIDTRSWLFEDLVLISPYNVNSVDWDEGIVWVNLSKNEIEHSPKADAHKITRKFEATFNNYFKLPHYWSNGLGMDIEGLWAGNYFPKRPEEDEQTFRASSQPNDGHSVLNDHHLHSVNEVLGFHLRAIDDDAFGAVEDFIIELDTWALRYIVFDTRKYLPGGKKVLLSPEWIENFDWDHKKLVTNSIKDSIEHCPAYDPSIPLDRFMEEELHSHFHRTGYWNFQSFRISVKSDEDSRLNF